MPYFDHQLKPLLDDLLLWADLRHEQRANVKPILRKLRKTLKQTRRDLRKLPPSPVIDAREPNELDAIRALRPSGPRKLWPELRTLGLHNRLQGAWLGRAAGCTLGAPVENWSIDAMEKLALSSGVPFPPEDYWPSHPDPDRPHYATNTMRDYLRGSINAAPVDDDLAYTLLGLLILETYGPCFTTAAVADAWLKWLPMACTAEHVALENLKAGSSPYHAADRKNPYQEWIGADIRSDPWGYAAPGWPERAAEMAWRDASLSHRRAGIYGSMFFAAAIAAAFAVDDPIEALRIGLTEIPADCRLAADIQWALAIGPGLKNWREARAAVDARFQGMHAVHTNNNACLTIFGLILGSGDFTRTIGITVAMGLDNDCTAATAGSLLGAANGIRIIPEHWWQPFQNRSLSYLNGYPEFSNTDIIARFLETARNVWNTP